MNYRNIMLNHLAGTTVSTDGLHNLIGNEISLQHFDDLNGEIQLMQYVIDYVLDEHIKINLNETISYGLWVLKFVPENNMLNIYELDNTFKEWVKGAENAIYYYELQKRTCEMEGAQFSIPDLLQHIAISDGVLQGIPVQGIRYKEPDHMSGWYLTTELYDGNISNIKVIPLQELVIHRKDLLEFLALPEKFAFKTFEDHTCQVWKVSDFSDGLHSN